MAGRLVSAGGRVLNVVGTGPDLAAARDVAYQAAGAIRMRGGWYRHDIAEAAARAGAAAPAAQARPPQAAQAKAPPAAQAKAPPTAQARPPQPRKTPTASLVPPPAQGADGGGPASSPGP